MKYYDQASGGWVQLSPAEILRMAGVPYRDGADAFRRGGDFYDMVRADREAGVVG